MDHNKIRRKNFCYSLQAPTKFVSRKGEGNPPPPAKAGVRKNNYSYGNNPKKDQEGRKEGEEGGRLRITSKRNEFSLFLYHYHSFFCVPAGKLSVQIARLLTG